VLYKEGTALNFDDLVKQYIKFLQSYSDDTIGWELIDNRHHSYFGATIAIPKTDYINNLSSDYSGKNIVIFLDDGIESEYIFDEYNNNYKINLNYFVNVLNRVYPNANIIPLNYKNLITTANPDGHLDYIANINNKIDKLVVFVQPFYTFSAGGFSSDSVFKSHLDAIDGECHLRGLDVDYIYAPTINSEDDKSIASQLTLSEVTRVNNYINLFITKYTKRKIYNFYDEMYKFDRSVFTTFFDDYCCGYLYDNVWAYNHFLSTLLTRFVMNRLFKLSREEFYVSIHYNSINSTTYYNFVMNSYMAEEFDSTESPLRKLHSKYGKWNPFRNSGELISIGVHTSFDYNVWMCEQGGITCKKEADAQVNDIDLLPFWWFFGGSPVGPQKPVVYPTTGCPWFIISTANKNNYLIGADNPIHYYFVKDNDNSTITIRCCDGNGKLNDVWQTISFGKMDGVLDTYNINPLYCAGGNQALSPDTWTYFNKSHVEGLSYDLDFKNPSLCNSGMLHPTKFGRANLSNFRIMNGSGTWDDIYAHYQTFSTHRYREVTGWLDQWGVVLNPPSDDIGISDSTAYPFGVASRNKIDTFRIYDVSYRDRYINDRYISTGQIDPLTIYLYKNK
jgi:hypothetical protein